VVLFSNLAQFTNATKDHPIQRELAEGRKVSIGKVFKKKQSKLLPIKQREISIGVLQKK
jgi:hypothetical protein